MKVSIISVYYNREDYVTESINSLLSQTYNDIEIIVVDDGSTDNTLNKLKEFSDSRLKIITQQNIGFVASIKKAIDISSGDKIAIHGSGDISHCKRIEKQINEFKNNSSLGVVGCFVENINLISEKASTIKPKIDSGISLTDNLKKKNLFTHGEVMFDKEIYYRVGQYRDFFKYSQDRDLWLRMSLESNFYIIPEVLYTRFQLSEGVGNDPIKIVMQKYFNEYSKISINNRLNNEIDIIDEYGIYSPFFRKHRSKELSNQLCYRSISSFMKGNLYYSIYFCELSIFEKRTILNTIFSFVFGLSKKSSTIFKVFSSFLRFSKSKYSN